MIKMLKEWINRKEWETVNMIFFKKVHKATWTINIKNLNDSELVTGRLRRTDIEIVLQGPVRSQSWALLGSNHGPDQSQKASEIKDRRPGPQKNAKNRSKPVVTGSVINTLKWGKIRAWRVKRYCSLTCYVNFKPLIVKIGWELNNLCHILWNSKIWRATFVISTIFLISQPVFIRIWWKLYQNLDKF